jgi:hypothetical protein
MIDTTAETLLTLRQAADALPRCRKGRKVHVRTLHRWATSESRGVVLETIMIGRTRCTSREALQRYFERLTQARAAGAGGAIPPEPVGRRSPARRQRDSEKAAEELERLGL